MKKIYLLVIISLLFLTTSKSQNNKKINLHNSHSFTCKSCINSNLIRDTSSICNIEPDDSLRVYGIDVINPIDSGWAIGHNAYHDMGWAEKFVVSGSANVMGGIYLLYEKSGNATSNGIATAKVYDTAGIGGKPGLELGATTIPFSSMKLDGTDTYFAFPSPIPVTNSFFMSFELGTYTLTGPDTIGVITTKYDDRSTTNPDQNCAMWNDGKWYFELTENFKFKTNYCLCTVVDIPFGVENYVTKNNLKLYSTYPNPTTNEVSIIYSLSNDSGGQILIDVFDLNGEKVLSIKRDNVHSGTFKEKINTSSLATGRYFYKIQTINSTIASTFLVVK